MFGGLPAIAVSLEPADCPTEAQLSRVLSAFGARLVPFGSPARATVFAQRDEKGEWSLVLGRPGHNEKRKVTLAGGCDERATALGAIIERFARPVLVPTKDPVVADAGVPDAGLVEVVDAGEPVDAGTPIAAVEPEPLLTPPPPPPSVEEPAPPPATKRFGIGARAGLGVTGAGASAVAGLWGDFTWRILSFGAALEYFGPVAISPGLRVDQVRGQLFARLWPITWVALEGGVSLSAVLPGTAGDVSYHAALLLGLVGRYPLGPVDVFLSARAWLFLNTDLDLSGVAYFPTFAGDFQAGVSVKF